MMEEKMLKLMAQLSLISIFVWVVMASIGKKPIPVIPAAPAPRWAKGDVWQKSCVAAPYGQPTFQPGIQMGVAYAAR
jgi:hypothetical protein